MTCPKCGAANADGANYCSTCGAYLGTDQPTETISMPAVGAPSTPAAPVAGGAELVVLAGGGREGERYSVGVTTTIGRSPASDVFLDDVTVSRDHAVLHADVEGVRIEDRGSLNGTFVQHQRVDRAELRPGDEVQVGKYRLVYVEEQQA